MNETEGTNRSIVIGLIVVIAVVVIAVLAYSALNDDTDDTANEVANTVDQTGNEIEQGAQGAATEVAQGAEGAATEISQGAEGVATEVGQVGETAGDTGEVGSAGGAAQTGGAADVQLSELVAVTDVGDDNCPVDQATTDDTFTAGEPVYVVASGASVPEGTSLYVRVLQNGTPVTQTQPISVAQGTQDSCLAFLLTPEGGTPLAAGQYEAQLMANDTEVTSVTFQVQ